jgi:EAL domain-containing protein (putative c-di-GMP-specific phosphodiesterase class I)
MRCGRSFARLKSFSIDKLKIDSSFMRQLKDNGVDRTTVESPLAGFDRIDKTRNGRRGA